MKFLRKILNITSYHSILYEVTPRCNLKCLHCYNVWKDDVGYPEKELGTSDAKRLIIKAILESGCRNFTFTGGEPLLRNDLEELVSTARAKCKSINLISNGTLLPEDRIKKLIDAGVSLFELPLNSSDRNVHDKMAGGFECFDKVTRAAADIRYHGGDIAFVFVGTCLNIKYWKDVLELGIALGARSFLFNRYNAGGECHGSPEDLMPSVADVMDGLSIAEEFSVKYGLGIGASITIQPCLIDTGKYPHVGFGFCAAGTERAYYTLDPVGNVRPCNHTPMVLGNILEQPLNRIIKSQKLVDFMKARPEFCSGCKIELDCQGGCKAAAEACYGSLSAVEPFLEINIANAIKPRS
ncbi:MAG TPA: hypothetical protein DET40_06005 [Lentisphaeria bacterium]|nr:MAG: hypothetical protein A2X45_04510 [Lentisphaerae bacterium GWF2_50_93]HCE43081.1 hypothetical protein [Lentisphaeria bacterium]